jgi:tripartite-type tricarboxylate transporter receptor subunit TctC
MRMVGAWRRRAALAGLAGLAAPRLARAAGFPQRAVRIIVPVPAGSVPDILARLLAERLAPRWGVPVLIDNRPGAGGAIGVEHAMRAAPDGHSLLLGSSGPIAILPAVQRRLPYDPQRDLLPLARIADFPLVFLASQASGLRSFAMLLDRARGAAEPLDYAGGDIGSTQHLAGALLAVRAGLRLSHVPYRGGGLAQADLIAGRIPLMVDSLSAVLRTILDGKAVPLGVCGVARAGQIPLVPTLGECGVPAYAASGWMGVFAPGATSPELAMALSATLLEVARDPAMQDRIHDVGSDPVVQDGPAFGRFIAEELSTWRRLAAVAGIAID